jgi:hypothetical protein
MGIEKLNTEHLNDQGHKATAMEFLLQGNERIDNPLSPKLIEDVYDLFAEEKPETQTFHRILDKLISTEE